MARPSVILSFSATYQRQSTNFRVVQDDAAAGGSYTIEKAELDAVGSTSWTEFVQVTTATSDRSQTKLTPNILTGLLDAAFPV